MCCYYSQILSRKSQFSLVGSCDRLGLTTGLTVQEISEIVRTCRWYRQCELADSYSICHCQCINTLVGRFAGQ